MKRLLLLIPCIVILARCVPPSEQPITDVTVDVRDKRWQKVYELVDRHEIDSLLRYTQDANPTYRYLLAHTLAGLETDKVLDTLVKLLQDPVMEVRSAAAYTLGQSGELKAAPHLLRAFRSKDTLSVDNEFNSTILEAVGKTAEAGLLSSIATVSTYRETDTLLLLGQARSIYRFALRGITVPEGTDKMVQFVTEPSFPASVRLVAANYLYRSKDLKIDDFKFRIAEIFTNDNNPHIRMALAVVLGNTEDRELLKILINQLEIEPDYRVRCNIIRALSSFGYVDIVNPVLDHLNDGSLQVAQTAADFLIANGTRNDAVVYRNYLNDSLPVSVNAKLYSAVLKHIPVFYTNTKSIINNDVAERYEAATNDYDKSAYLRALGYDPYNYKNIGKILSETSAPVLKSSGMEALHDVLKSENFAKAHRSRSARVKKEIIEIIKAEVLGGDVGAIAVAGNILADQNLGLKDLIDSTKFMQQALGRLTIPQEIESYNSLKKALDYLSGEQHIPLKPSYNHPIDYNVFTTYGDSQQVVIKTDIGLIRLDMYVRRAPGSVANFLNLVDDGFYNDKAFHRVVPNFVIQAGCPRGDGYGSLDYTIRSELAGAYYDDEGYIGMASAGADTEGTQWFITHSPAMHLDGKYTIFGKVVEGMDVVHNIKVGDRIIDIIITKK